MAWAAEAGLSSGVGGGLAAPEAGIARQDFAALITRYAAHAGLAIPVLRPYAPFTDEAGIDGYALEAVRALAAGGILNGKPGGLFDPAGGATRAEAAAILHRFI
jgi:hypothetical protein